MGALAALKLEIANLREPPILKAVFQVIATDGGLTYLRSDLLHSIGVRHAFSTRVGGVSEPPFDRLNLGNPTGQIQDDWNNIHENYRRLQTAVGCAQLTRCWVHQIHGGEVAVVRRGDAFESGVRADAMVSDDPVRLLSIRVADCTPVLLATQDGRAVAAVHAGWRGVIQNIVPSACAQLRQLNDGPIVAAIGPAIGFEAFEVGAEVLAQFREQFGDDPQIVRQRDETRGHVNLALAIRRQLLNSQVPADRIEMAEQCTYRNRAWFFSHRRDGGVAGRMAALIAAVGE